MVGRVNVQIASVVSAIVVIREIRLAVLWIHELDATNPATVDRTTISAVNIFGDSRWFAEPAYREH